MDLFLEVHELSDLQFHGSLWCSGCRVGGCEQEMGFAEPQQVERGAWWRGTEGNRTLHMPCEASDTMHP
jgi:hypothetical protein